MPTACPTPVAILIEALVSGLSVHKRLCMPLRPEALSEGRRVSQIAEEDCDLFSLAFKGTSGRENLLGEVLRSVGLGRGEAGKCSRLRPAWLASAKDIVLLELVLPG